MILFTYINVAILYIAECNTHVEITWTCALVQCFKYCYHGFYYTVQCNHCNYTSKNIEKELYMELHAQVHNLRKNLRKYL